jgi:hypothetical protein
MLRLTEGDGGGNVARAELVIIWRKFRPSVIVPDGKIFVEALIKGGGQVLLGSTAATTRMQIRG